MKVTKYIKWALIALTVTMFTACNESNTTHEEAAITNIMEYAESGKVAPTVQDYIDANVTGMTEDNLDELNEVVENSKKEEVDTTEEIQALADEVGVANKQSTVAAAREGNSTTIETNTPAPTTNTSNSCGTSACGSTCPTSACGASACGSTCPTSACGASACGSTCGSTCPSADTNSTCPTSTCGASACGSTCPTSACNAASTCGASACGSTCPSADTNSTCPTSACGSTCNTGSACGASTCGTSACGSTCPTSACGASTCGTSTCNN